MRLIEYASRSVGWLAALLRRPPDNDADDTEVRDLRWKDVREDWKSDGSGFMEIYVFDTSVDDWQRLRDVIPLHWESTFNRENEWLPMPPSMRELFEQIENEGGVSGYWYIKVYEDMELRSIIDYPEEIRFDLGPEDVVGQPQLDAVCEFVRVIGTTLATYVLVCWECMPRGEPDAMEYAIMRYDPETDTIVRVLPPEPKSLFELWDEDRRRSDNETTT